MRMVIKTPLGLAQIEEIDNKLVSLEFGKTADVQCTSTEDLEQGLIHSPDSCLFGAAAQLIEYLAGRRRRFNVPLNPTGTPFQKRVWKELLSVPYGKTVSYKELADAAGCRHGARAVGYAMKSNPIPIFIPCHRVIRKDGSIGGYTGGPDKKRFLLSLEKHLFEPFPNS